MKGEKPIFNYSKLIYCMHMQGYNQSRLSKEIGMSLTTFNSKIRSKSEFKQSEIIKIIKVCNIEDKNLHEYFFCVY